MTTRDKILEALLKIDERVYYGIVPESESDKDWNYLVFGKSKISIPNATSLVEYYEVTIVREDYIPDETVYEVLDAMTDIAGVRIANESMMYEYALKGSTSVVVEILTIQFSKPLKRCR